LHHVSRNVHCRRNGQREDDRKLGTEKNVIMNIRYIKLVFYVMKPGRLSCVGLKPTSKRLYYKGKVKFSLYKPRTDTECGDVISLILNIDIR
jgi:hypothetical protein